MNDLMKTDMTQFTVNGRELQKKLGSKGDHTHWAKDQIRKGDLVEGESYSWLATSRPKGGIPRMTIWFTSEVGAILQALSKTQVGVQTTVALVQHAAQAQHDSLILASMTPAQLRLYADAKEAAQQAQTALARVEDEKRQIMLAVEPAILLERQFYDNIGDYTLKSAAHLLKIPERKFATFLKDQKIIFMHKTDWQPMARYIKSGYFGIGHPHVPGNNIKIGIRVTASGLVWLKDRYAKVQRKKVDSENMLAWLFAEDPEHN